jgi:hypothetical protein
MPDDLQWGEPELAAVVMEFVLFPLVSSRGDRREESDRVGAARAVWRRRAPATVKRVRSW